VLSRRVCVKIHWDLLYCKLQSCPVVSCRALPLSVSLLTLQANGGRALPLSVSLLTLQANGGRALPLSVSLLTLQAYGGRAGFGSSLRDNKSLPIIAHSACSRLNQPLAKFRIERSLLRPDGMAASTKGPCTESRHLFLPINVVTHTHIHVHKNVPPAIHRTTTASLVI